MQAQAHEREFIPAQEARKQGLLEGPIAVDPKSFRAILDDSVRYWELRRIAYNLILTVIVLIVDFFGHRGALLSQRLLPLVVLAVLANLCYSTAYIPDLGLQYSSFRSRWLQVRPLLFGFGTLLASGLAYEIVSTVALSLR